MDAPTVRREILEMLERLTPEQLEVIREFVAQMSESSVSGLYSLHEHAISTGVSDLAAQHDRYLYQRTPSDA